MFGAELTKWTFGNIILRMITAVILGSLIGIDRGVKKRGGGARTDAAVCLGAAMVMMTAQYMSIQFPGKIDISRMASQVVSGVGFLGAGSIIVARYQVKGLTSAASIWICACIGLAAGIGFIDGAILVTAILLAGLHLIPLIEEKIYHYSRYVILYVEAEDSQTAAALLHKLRADGCKIDMYDIDKPKAGGQSFSVLATVHIAKHLKREEYLEGLEKMDGILSVDSM